MNLGRTVFSQLVNFLPTYQFQLCVDRYQGNRYVKDFSCWEQFLCLAFAQLTYRESLRDIEACLRAQQPKLYHMGFRGQVSRNTLAHANEHRDWRIYADFAQVLIAAARDIYRGESFGVELSETVYALDSTTIDLCLSLFPTGKATDTNRWSWSPGHTRSRTVPLQKILHGKCRERRQSRLGRNRRRSASRGVRWRVPTCCEKLGPGSPYDRAWVAEHEDKLRYRGGFRDK